MKFVIYIRVSTDQQGLSIEVQRDICMKYISQNNGNEFIEFIDNGFSGALDLNKRPGLFSAISSLENGDILLIAKRDRIGRDVIVNAMIEREVQKRKANIVSASGDVCNDNDPSSILMKRMVDAFSEYERLIIGSRIKSALQLKKSRNERVGHIPYGFKLSADKLHLEINENEMNNLLIMFELRLRGFSHRTISFNLNRLQIYNRKGEWTHSAIIRVMKNKDGLISSVLSSNAIETSF